ncbi:MAG: hypothetical protein RIR25_1829 [Verrucomicrobiota bacterium]
MNDLPNTAEAVVWYVLDTNQGRGGDRNQPRIHTGPSGRDYPLFAAPDKKCPMPKADALVFLKDAAFAVYNEDGSRVPSLPESEAPDRHRRALDLPVGQVVAKLEELDDTALQARLALRPGGSTLLVDYDRAAAIVFLKEAPALKDMPPQDRERFNTEDPDMVEGRHTGLSVEDQLREVGVTPPPKRVAKAPISSNSPALSAGDDAGLGSIG